MNSITALAKRELAGGTGHAGSYIIPELVAAGHEVTGLAQSDTGISRPADHLDVPTRINDEPLIGREAAVETMKTVNGLSSDDTYFEVLSGDPHHAAHFRPQVGDAAVNGIFLVLLDTDGKIAEVDIFYRTLPRGPTWDDSRQSPMS